MHSIARRFLFIVGGAVSVSSLAVGCGAHDADSSEHALLRSAQLLPTSMSFSVPLGTDYHRVATGSRDTLLLGDRSRLLTSSGGYAESSTSGNVRAHYGYDTKVGSIQAAGAVEVFDRALVSGSITAGQAITFGLNASPTPAPANVTVTGAISPNAAMTPLQTYSWTVNYNTGTANVTQTSGTRNLAPGSYASVNVQGGTVVLRSGTYYIDNLTLEPNGKISVTSSSGPVFIYIRNSFIDHGTWSAAPSDVMLGYLGSNLLALEKPFAGTVVAPNARVRFAVGGTPHSGSVFAKEVELDPDVKFTQVTFSRWDLVNVDVVPRFNCFQTRSDGKTAAVFGYNNPTATTMTIALGANNKFATGAQDRQQPTTFFPGSVNQAFAVEYNGTAITWTLNGSAATASGSATDPALQCAQPGASAVKDTTVTSAQPGANFGSDTTLTVNTDSDALVGFERADLKSKVGVGRIVTSAQLVLNVTSGTGTDIQAMGVSRAWTETGATWNCANDTDATAAGEHCLSQEQWRLTRRDGTNDNPWFKRVSSAVVSGSTVSFDVTKDLNEFLGNGARGLPASWILQTTSTSVTQFSSREAGANVAPKLVIQTAPILDTDAPSYAPLSFSVDPTIPVRSGNLPPLPGGPARPRAAVAGPKGQIAEFTENELLVFSDDSTQVSAVANRWNATEILSQDMTTPGYPQLHVLRVDPSRADIATLVPNLQRLDNRPRGAHRISSTNGLALLAIAADEANRGTPVAVNWVPYSTEFTLDSVVDNETLDGPQSGSSTEENSLNWDYLKDYHVPQAWQEMLFANKMRFSRDVVVLDTGFADNYFDAQRGMFSAGYAGSTGENVLEPDKKWHGTHVVNAGFSEPGDSRGSAGPGGPVSNVTAVWGYGDMVSLGLYVPNMSVAHIVNSSHAIPVPAVLSWTNWPGEAITMLLRASGILFFASSGNDHQDIDDEDCFIICWESSWYFPCENNGVDCVGGTWGHDAGSNDRYAVYDGGNGNGSNYGAEDVDYYGPWNVYSTGDYDNDIDPSGVKTGTRIKPIGGTSFASPFIAGIAALTWAANVDQSAGDVEDCLTRQSIYNYNGGSHHVVQAAESVWCALGYPNDFKPKVKIESPSNGDEASLGFNTARAIAADYEDGVLDVYWSVNGSAGSQSASGANYTYSILSPGQTKLVATAFDSTSNQGSDTVRVEVPPTQPVIEIEDPAWDGRTCDDRPCSVFYPGIPLTLLANEAGASTQPCSSFVWNAYLNATGSPANHFVTNASGCVLPLEFPTTDGDPWADVSASLTAYGLTGTANRRVDVDLTPKPRVRIVSPARTDRLRSDKEVPDYGLVIHPGDSLTFTAKSVNFSGAVIYRWLLDQDGNRTVFLGQGTNRDQVTWTAPTNLVNCRYVNVLLGVQAWDGVNQASDKFYIVVQTPCPPTG